ncbi:hypothetical protein LC612_32315 [Nostoc sp. CHAB 5834]|nr:hypothetical protein [Nostoc sp. CHAB 5834]
MSHSVKTYCATISVNQGDFTHFAHRLIVAQSESKAFEVANSIMTMMYSEPEDAEVSEYGTVVVCGGELSLSINNVREIGLATFNEMSERLSMPVYRQEGLNQPTAEDLASLKAVGAAVTKSLENRGVQVSHSQVLDALASAVGDRNWKQYSARVVPSPLLEQVFSLSCALQHHKDTQREPLITALYEVATQIQQLRNASKAPE